MPAIPPSVKGAIDLDPYLSPYALKLYQRQLNLKEWISKISENESNLLQFASSYEKYGLHSNHHNKSITYVEYAPEVTSVSLIGEFNNWDRNSHKLQKGDFGLWSITIPPTSTGEFAIHHDSKIKVSMVTATGETIDRLPPWITRATQPTEETNHTYDGRFWNPSQSDIYTFKHNRPAISGGIKIYEAHIGISTSEPTVGSYKNFTENILPLIHKLGYNTIQLMAIMEHAYYASFGYQITNFFAASSRFGTPEELKELIDTAHGMGIQVLLDIVHSHASKNVLDGLNQFNGTDHYYFHSGSKGNHELWDSKLFNYDNYETLRFLLSNLKFWIDTYKFDGFRFDGVTSMIYKHHGNGVGFSGHYDEYFGNDVDEEALTYLMLANQLLLDISERDQQGFKFTTIAEDVSGMPTLCLPSSEGGIGFSYRLSMAIPDMWIKLLKHSKDEDWNLSSIVHTLTNRRYGEDCIGYCESHDQALVGDKTIAFWLMDKEMYYNMSKLSPLSLVIDRGISLHKLIRLITQSLGGEGYLNFEGNEFGHPEWLDFPRVGNGNSYHYARRQFNLIKDKNLRYQFLFNFDSYLQHLDSAYNYLNSPQAYVSLKNENDKIVVYERNGLLFILNLHPTNSYQDYKVGVDIPGVYNIVLNSDDAKFGGHARVDNSTDFFTINEPWNNRGNSLFVYIPSRTGLVLQLKDKIVALDVELI